MFRTSLLAAGACLALAGPALAHHGFGLFQMNINTSYDGVLTRMDLVNPHSYMNFDIEKDGEKFSMRCEMRAASLIKRMGWKEEQFVIGSKVHIEGHPHRDDPHSCYLETFTLGDAPTVGRNQQIGDTVASVDTSNRPLALPSGEPNITGDWAVEQGILTIAPKGSPSGEIVPASVSAAYGRGEITIEEIRARSTPPARPVYTEAGEAKSKSFRRGSPEDSPWLRCAPTSITLDWTRDWPVNRITQKGSEIVIDYGLVNATRTIHMDQKEHPADITPSNAGHSIGHWEGNTLVVDTVGFEPGVLNPPTFNSAKMHIVERFTLGQQKKTDGSEELGIKREYTVEDPEYLAQPITGSDVVFLSLTPWEPTPCKELTYEFSEGLGKTQP